MARNLADSVRNLYSSVNVTTGAWVTLISSLAEYSNMANVIDTSGQTLELGLGPSGSEVRCLLIGPNFTGNVPLQASKGVRVAIRAVSGNATTGEIDINFFR